MCRPLATTAGVGSIGSSPEAGHRPQVPVCCGMGCQSAHQGIPAHRQKAVETRSVGLAGKGTAHRPTGLYDAVSDDYDRAPAVTETPNPTDARAKRQKDPRRLTTLNPSATRAITNHGNVHAGQWSRNCGHALRALDVLRLIATRPPSGFRPVDRALVPTGRFICP